MKEVIGLKTYSIEASQLKYHIPKLHTFDRVLLSGTIYTARDAAHKKIKQLIAEKKTLPFDINGAIVYYAGPTPSPQHLPIGSCGPTTSGRMDVYTPDLLDLGLTAMIGKGERSQNVIDAIVRNQAIYLCAIGGAGALACEAITSQEVIAFEELGCESVKRLQVKDFPLIVAIDANGVDIFQVGKQQYLDSLVG